jgi:hypothetical protein
MNKLLITALLMIFLACGSSQDNQESNENIGEVMEMLESVFVGPYDKYMIKKKMDMVFEMYQINPKREDYLIVGNTLVALRKQGRSAYVEMDIINDMIKTNSALHGISFDEQLNRTVDILDRNLASN